MAEKVTSDWFLSPALVDLVDGEGDFGKSRRWSDLISPKFHPLTVLSPSVFVVICTY